jgi:hypothetical protein
VAGAMLIANAFAQSSPIVPVENEPPPKLTVETPLARPLARARCGDGGRCASMPIDTARLAYRYRRPPA